MIVTCTQVQVGLVAVAMTLMYFVPLFPVLVESLYLTQKTLKKKRGGGEEGDVLITPHLKLLF